MLAAWGGLAGCLVFYVGVLRGGPIVLAAVAGGAVPVVLVPTVSLLLLFAQVAGLVGLCLSGWRALFTASAYVMAVRAARREPR
ncbi:hypothetical protein [Streptomyces marianii]|uniref:hypothetical protein n=1 Tax=Streptomyces marianii TaxID=1817406 RepID=UPI0010FE4A39|nr:hypothetical protein [Streptomyces marianii]